MSEQRFDFPTQSFVARARFRQKKAARYLASCCRAESNSWLIAFQRSGFIGVEVQRGPAEGPQRSRRVGIQLLPDAWILAFAGMTQRFEGVSNECPSLWKNLWSTQAGGPKIVR